MGLPDAEDHTLCHIQKRFLHRGEIGLPMSALGQSRRLQQIAEMSGFLPIAIIGPPTVADK
jgi:hypothetical protein